METKPTDSLTVTEALQLAAVAFNAFSESAQLDAAVLLGHIMERPRAWLVSHPDSQLDAKERSGVTLALKEAAAGMPLPYLVGHQEFFGLDFHVNRNVLIPRPETELLVELALMWLKAHPGRRVAADIGTGSGCIAISLAVNLPDLIVYACDISRGALSVAEQNVRQHQVGDRVHIECGDLMGALPRAVDVLCANLPYIPSSTLEGLPIARYEPPRAGDGGMDGLVFIRRLLTQTPGWVRPGGLIVLEIEEGQGPAVISLAGEGFPDASIKIHPDLAGLDRVLSIELPGESDTMTAERPNGNPTVSSG
jgi:release factor glutamine methyltransferase